MMNMRRNGNFALLPHRRREHGAEPASSAGFLQSPHQPAILDPHPDGKIEAIDVERDRDILGAQMWPQRVVKPHDFAAGEDQAAHRLGIACPAFETIAQMDRADLVLVGA